MEYYTLECVACGALQPQSDFTEPDPLLYTCCQVLDSILTQTLKSQCQDGNLVPTGTCLLCNLAVQSPGVCCNRQSCFLWMALNAGSSGRNIAVFHIRPCAWTGSEVKPLTVRWTRDLLAPTLEPQQQLSRDLCERLFALVFGSAAPQPLDHQLIDRHE